MTIDPNLIRGEDYQDLRKQLNLVFGTATSPTSAAFTLLNRTQQENETVHAFARDIGMLAHQAFPDNRQTARRQAVNAFCTGLRDVTLSQILCSSMASFTTLADAETRAQYGSYAMLRRFPEEHQSPKRNWQAVRYTVAETIPVKRTLSPTSFQISSPNDQPPIHPQC